METFVDAGELARAVGRVLKNLPDAPVVRLCCESSDRLSVSGTVDGRWSEALLPAETADGQGETLVSGRWLESIVKAMPAGEIRIRDDGSWLVLSGGGASLRLRRTDPDAEGVTVPLRPHMPEVMHPVDPDGFTRVVSHVAGSCAKPKELDVLHAICLTCEDGALTAEATDRSVCSRSRMNAPGLPDGRWLIPGRWLNGLLPVTRLGVSGSTIVLQNDTDSDLTPILDGRWPNLSPILDDMQPMELTIRVDRRGMLDAVRMLKSVNFTTRPVIPIRIDPTEKGDGLGLRLMDSDSEGRRRLEADVEGGGFPFTLNAEYLLSTLGMCESEEVTFGLRHASQSGRLKPVIVSDGGTDTVHAISPVRMGA